jgi:hypothetical protein
MVLNETSSMRPGLIYSSVKVIREVQKEAEATVTEGPEKKTEPQGVLGEQ